MKYVTQNEMQNQPIMSGKILDAIKKLSSGLLKSFNKLLDYGLDVKSGDTNDDGSVNWTIIDRNKNEIKMLQIPLYKNHEKSGRYDLEFKWEKGNKSAKKENVPESNIDKVITDVINDFTGDDIEEGKKEVFDNKETSNEPNGASNNSGATDENEQDTNTSTESDTNSSIKLVAKLHKITSGTNSGVYVTGIKANCDISEAQSIIDNVISDDSFVAELNEAPTNYLIVDEDNSYDVNKTNSISDDEYRSIALTKMLITLYKAFIHAQTLHWNSRGIEASITYQFTDSLIYHLLPAINDIAELHVEYFGYIDDPMMFLENEYDNINSYSRYTSSDNSLTILRDLISECIGVIELYMINMPADTQNLFNDIIRKLKKESDYYIKKVLS